LGKTLIKLKTDNVTKRFFEMLGWQDCGGLEAPSVVVFAALLIKRGNSGKEEA